MHDQCKDFALEVIVVEKTLQATANAADVVSLTYDAERESVTVKFDGGSSRVINAAMDSGTAMIRDVMKQLGC